MRELGNDAASAVAEAEQQGEAAGGEPGSHISGSQTSLADVPDELLQLCFARMPVRFVHRVRAVCKRWHRLGHSDHLRKLRSSLGLTEQWTVVLANGFEKNDAFRGLQGHAYHDLGSSGSSEEPWSLRIRTLDTPHRVLFGVVAGTNGIVYVLGGRSPLISGKPNEWEVFSRVDAYDPLRNRWSPAPAMRTARYGFAAGAYVDPLTREARGIVAGGYDAHGQALALAEVLGVGREEGWEDIPSMLQLQGACRGQVVNGRFYVVQANADPHYIEEYNPLEKRWSLYAGADRPPVCFPDSSTTGCAVLLNI